MKVKILLFFLFVYSPFSIAQQQQEQNPPLFSHVALTAGVTTLGITVEAVTPLARHFYLKGGLNYFSYTTHQHRIAIDDPYGLLNEAFGQAVSYEMQGDAKNFHGHLVVDYYPFQKGILYLSGGFYFGNTKLTARGIITNRDGSPAQLQPQYEWPDLEFNGQKIDITNGRLNAELKLGHLVKPYIGIGLGRAIPRRRLGVKMEVGLLFAGNYTLKQNGVNVETMTTKQHNFEDTDAVMDLFKYYPMVKVQLNYRLF